MILRKVFKCYKSAFSDTLRHDGIEHAGYISFLCMLSIFPFFIFFTATLAMISDKYLQGSSDTSILSILTSVLIECDFANLISALKPRIIEITSTPPQSFVSLAIFSVIWTASSLLEGLRTILNRAYRVAQPPSYLLRRTLSIAQFIFITFIVMIIIFSIKLLPAISHWMLLLIEDLSEYAFITKTLNVIIVISEKISWLISPIISFLFLSYIYYLIPNKKQKFPHTFLGTFNTIVLWQISTKAFQYYLSAFQQINIVYGSVAGIIIALLYFYICSIVFIYGAELNYWADILLFKDHDKDKIT